MNYLIYTTLLRTKIEQSSIHRLRVYILRQLGDTTSAPLLRNAENRGFIHEEDNFDNIIGRIDRTPLEFDTDPHRPVIQRDPYAHIRSPTTLVTNYVASSQLAVSLATSSVRTVPPPPAVDSLVHVIGGKKIAAGKGVLYRVTRTTGDTFSYVEDANIPGGEEHYKKNTSLQPPISQ